LAEKVKKTGISARRNQISGSLARIFSPAPPLLAICHAVRERTKRSRALRIPSKIASYPFGEGLRQLPETAAMTSSITPSSVLTIAFLLQNTALP
jgi:hypothetical protein